MLPRATATQDSIHLDQKIFHLSDGPNQRGFLFGLDVYDKVKRLDGQRERAHLSAGRWEWLELWL